MDDDKLSVPAEQRGRQAIASLVGYVHQLITTVAAWMRLGLDDYLLVEVAEDYAVLAQGALTMTQVKREARGAALTLRRSDVGKAIVSLWQFSNANPGLNVRLHFLTTAVAGHEQGVQFPEGLTGLAYWAHAAIGGDVERLQHRAHPAVRPDAAGSDPHLLHAGPGRGRLKNRSEFSS